MFRIIQGPPGSGKTFYAVNYLKKFTEYDKLYDSMILDSSVLLVTNIDEIKVHHMSIDEFRERDFIDPDTLKEYLKNNNYKRVVYIHDEAQKTYGGMKDNKEFFFLEYSRHLGIDVFLIVQTVSALPRRITDISEYVIEARPRTIGVIGFQYDLKDAKTGSKLGSITVKKDQDVFRLYKSFDISEIEPPKKIILRKLVVGGVVMAVAAVLVVVMLQRAFHVQTSKKMIKTPKPQAQTTMIKKTKTKKPEKEKQNEVEIKEPYYVYMEGQGAGGTRPHGRLKGVSETSFGTYFFYE